MLIQRTQLKKNSVNNNVLVVLRTEDATSSVHAPDTGEPFGDLTIAYQKNTDTAHTAVTAVAGTEGSWTSAGWIELDATALPGVYQFSVPNAALQGGPSTTQVVIRFKSNETGSENTILIIDLFRSLAQ